MPIAARHPDGEPGHRIFMRAKSNIGPDDGGFNYELQVIPMRRRSGSKPSKAAMTSGWIWSLPEGGHQNAKMATKPCQGNVATFGEREPSDELTAKLRKHKLSIVSILKREAAGIEPLEPDEAETGERKGMARDSVPQRYLDAWARLHCQRPEGVTEQAWRQAIDDAGRFLARWGSLADSFGWLPGDLFDVPRDLAMGLVWWLRGRAVTALGPEHAAARATQPTTA